MTEIIRETAALRSVVVSSSYWLQVAGPMKQATFIRFCS